MPGTSWAACHRLFAWLARNAWVWPELPAELPAAAQLPAAPQDTEQSSELKVFSGAVPRICCAVPQVPLVSVATNAASWPMLWPYVPPARQFPAATHDTASTSAVPPWLSAAIPGTTCALPQVPVT